MNGDFPADHGERHEELSLLSPYLDDALTASERLALERHLVTCDSCQRELKALRDVRALLRAMPEPKPPRSFTLPEQGALPVATYRAQAKRGSRAGRLAQWTGGAVAAAGLAVIVGSALAGNMVPYAPTAASSAPSASRASSAFGPAPMASPSVNADESRPVPFAGIHSVDRPTATSTPGLAKSTTHPDANTAIQSSDAQHGVGVLPYAGIGLAAGGLILLVGGTVARRHER